MDHAELTPLASDVPESAGPAIDVGSTETRVPRTAWTWFVGTFALAALILFYRLGAAPIELWDESRVADNALEMALKGWSLVTTYDGATDHWNTKPPLLTWLMAASIRVFGADETAVRLPSVLAAIATTTCVYWFCAGELKRPRTGFLAVAVLLCTPTYMFMHGARSGDFDACLTLWTTAYVLAAFLFVHAPAGRTNRWLFICSLCICLAILTKSIQGLIFLPALLIYAAFAGALPKLLRAPATYASLALIVLVAGGYFFARESVDPGYFDAVRMNDLGGRFGSSAEGHVRGPFWYVADPKKSIWILVAVASVSYLHFKGDDRMRSVSIYLSLASLFYLLVISASATKLEWYALPLSPLVAILAAMGIAEVGRFAIGRGPSKSIDRHRLAFAATLLVAVGAVGLNVLRAERFLASKRADENDQYSLYLREFGKRPDSPKKFVVVFPGYPGYPKADELYSAPILFYVTALRASGSVIEFARPDSTVPAGFDTLVLCGASLTKVSAVMTLVPIATMADCGTYRIKS